MTQSNLKVSIDLLLNVEKIVVGAKTICAVGREAQCVRKDSISLNK